MTKLLDRFIPQEFHPTSAWELQRFRTLLLLVFASLFVFSLVTAVEIIFGSGTFTYGLRIVTLFFLSMCLLILLKTGLIQAASVFYLSGMALSIIGSSFFTDRISYASMMWWPILIFCFYLLLDINYADIGVVILVSLVWLNYLGIPNNEFTLTIDYQRLEHIISLEYSIRAFAFLLSMSLFKGLFPSIQPSKNKRYIFKIILTLASSFSAVFAAPFTGGLLSPTLYLSGLFVLLILQDLPLKHLVVFMILHSVFQYIGISYWSPYNVQTTIQALSNYGFHLGLSALIISLAWMVRRYCQKATSNI